MALENQNLGTGSNGMGRRDRSGGPVRDPALRTSIGKLFDRQPPASPEAEMSLLGSMILDPRVVTDVLAIIRGPEAFYDERHGKIYQAIVQTVDQKGTVDPVLLLDLLRDQGVLELIGGPAYIEKLALEVPTAVNAPYFAKLVSEKHKLRRLIDAAGEVLFDTYNNSGATGDDAKLLVDAAEQKIFEIAQEEQTSDTESIEALLMKEYSRLMAIEAGQPAESGVMTGFVDLDRDLTGLHGGEMVILAARPSMGKTALALNIAEQIALGTEDPKSTHAVRPRVPIGVFSLEMSKASLAQRLLASWSGVSSQHIRAGHLGKTDYDKLLAATQQLGQAPMYIDDTPGLTLMSLRARARRMVAQHKVKVIMLDYLQLLSSPQSARESRQAEVSSISRGVKALARDLNVSIVALSQLNRNPEGRENNRPRLSDLRESGSIEQDADVVLLLHREDYYHVGDENWLNDPANVDKVGVAEVIIAKQRNGPTGTVKLSWSPESTRFKNYLSPDQVYDGGSRRGGTYEEPKPYGGVTAPFQQQGSPFGGSPASGNGGGFPAGRQNGPVQNHRDGGGPDRADDAGDDEPAPF